MVETANNFFLSVQMPTSFQNTLIFIGKCQNNDFDVLGDGSPCSEDFKHWGVAGVGSPCRVGRSMHDTGHCPLTTND